MKYKTIKYKTISVSPKTKKRFVEMADKLGFQHRFFVDKLMDKYEKNR